MKNSTLFALLFISCVFFSCNTTQKQEPENNDFSYLDNSSEAEVYNTDDKEQPPVEQTLSCENSRVELIGILLQKNRVVLTDNVKTTVLVTVIALNKPISMTCNNGKNIEIKEVAIHTNQSIDNLIGSTVFAIGDVKYDTTTDISQSKIADAEVVRIETVR